MHGKFYSVLIAGIFAVGASPAAAAEARSSEWPLDAQHMRAGQVWAVAQGSGVTVAVLDSGCQADHPDLAGQLLTGAGFVGVAGDTGQSDISSNSHGTSIAAIIAGSGKNDSGTGMIGLAPRAKILPVRVTVSGEAAPVALAEGIIYAADHGAKVISISETSTSPDPNLRSAVSHALDKGSVVVAAAGNDGENGNPASYPAYFPGVVAVTGVDSDNRFWPSSEHGPQATLAAPAANILSANNHGGYLHGDGTSYAAPYVAATVALVWSHHPELKAGQVIRQIIDTADRRSEAAHDDQYGFGTVNPLRALTSPVTTASGIPAVTAEPAGPSWPLLSGIAAGAIAVATGVGFFVRGRRRLRGAKR